MKNDRCCKCRFWIPFVNGSGERIYGECHRHPPTAQRVPAPSHPQLFPAVYDLVRDWPRPDALDWCGDYRPNTTDQRIDTVISGIDGAEGGGKGGGL